MKRTFDASRINYLVNHPAIRPHIGGDIDCELDLTAAVSDVQNIFLDGEHGGFACSWSAPDTYEIHTFVLPEGRGKWAMEFAEWGKQYLWDKGAKHIWTRVHPDAANVKAFTLKMGLEPAGVHRIDLGAGLVAYELFDRRMTCQQ